MSIFGKPWSWTGERGVQGAANWRHGGFRVDFRLDPIRRTASRAPRLPAVPIAPDSLAEVENLVMRLSLAFVSSLLIGAATRAEAPRVLSPYARPTLIAHRGASADAPEHTLAAYELALRQGADFVEPDLQLTKDGVLVCLHDTTLERTTNVEQVFPERATLAGKKKQWPVVDFTLEEIQRLDAGSWMDAKFAGARVPTLQQMIDLVKGRAGIIPETKAPQLYGRLGQNMERALIEILAKNQLDTPGADPKTPVIIQSFSRESLETLRRDHACRLPLVFLTAAEDTTAEGLKAVRAFADGVAPNKKDVLARVAMVKEAHDLGMSVTVWTFRAGQQGEFASVRDEMRHFLGELKVDALFTDNPDQFPRDDANGN
jgi:glycerophosphoryl diester phosphodiesterase